MNLLDTLTDTWSRHGAVTPEILVEEAAPEGAALHDRFEWNDEIAGHRYRIVQAQELIRKVYLTVADDETTHPLRRVRAFGNVPVEVGGRAYLPTGEIMRDPKMADAFMEEAERAWRALWARYGHLAEFRAIVLRDVD
jgi:hypothetical protein